MDLSGPCPGLAMTVMTLLPSLDEILSPPKFVLDLLLPSTKEVVRGRDELIAEVGDEEYDDDGALPGGGFRSVLLHLHAF